MEVIHRFLDVIFLSFSKSLLALLLKKFLLDEVEDSPSRFSISFFSFFLSDTIAKTLPTSNKSSILTLKLNNQPVAGDSNSISAFDVSYSRITCPFSIN